MTSGSSTKFLLASSAVVVLTFCFVSDANAQRGFRLGRILQAGGGQGFRLGGERFGIQAGAGQGTNIWTQNLDMRFGNGRGAQFGGPRTGIQFGGVQGTQIGQLPTTSAGAPGTNDAANVQNENLSRRPRPQVPVLGQSVVKPTVAGQPAAPRPTVIVQGEPATISSAVKPPQTPSFAAPLPSGTPSSALETQLDIARQPDRVTEKTNTNRPALKIEAPLPVTKGKSILVRESTESEEAVEKTGSTENDDDR